MDRPIVRLGLLALALVVSCSSIWYFWPMAVSFFSSRPTAVVVVTAMPGEVVLPPAVGTPTPGAISAEPTATPPAGQVPENPLVGEVYTTTAGPAFDFRWDNWSLWQPSLPTSPEDLKPFVATVKIPAGGPYLYFGVDCSMHLDPEHNGMGTGNPETVGRGNAQLFSVPSTTKDGYALALIKCKGNASTGVAIHLQSAWR